MRISDWSSDVCSSDLVVLTFFEVTGHALLQGLREGRYDVGVSLQDSSDPDLNAQPLWAENMAVAMSASLCLPNRAKLTIADLHDYPVYRWQAEVCQPLDERLASVMPAAQEETQRVTSFEMVALWVARSEERRVGKGWGSQCTS